MTHKEMAEIAANTDINRKLQVERRIAELEKTSSAIIDAMKLLVSETQKRDRDMHQRIAALEARGARRRDKPGGRNEEQN